MSIRFDSQRVEAWRAAGVRIAGHFVVSCRRHTSFANFVRYQHECVYLHAKG